jgi:MoxR-like ATPase
LGAKARALLEGRFHVTTEDIKAIAHPVLRHRLVTTFAAQSTGITADRVIDMLLEKIPVEITQRAEKMNRG